MNNNKTRSIVRDWIHILEAILGVSVILMIILNSFFKDSQLGIYMAPFWSQLKIVLPFSILSVMLIHAMILLGRKKIGQSKGEQKEQDSLEYKYQILKNQVNPHFLFNSFNVLQDMVYDDPDKSSEFVQKMSDLYRKVIDAEDKQKIALLEELEFVQNYIFLLKARFEDKLEFRLEDMSQVKADVVPMALQLLIENAVKHNKATKKDHLIIEIGIKDGYIVVSNNIQLKSSNWRSTKTGTKYLYQQYGHLTDKKISLTKEGEQFVARLPLL